MVDLDYDGKSIQPAISGTNSDSGIRELDFVHCAIIRTAQWLTFTYLIADNDNVTILSDSHSQTNSNA
jgi:hypothetical protein